jgi:hypothetical protein
MKLFDELIDALSDEKTSLSDGLLKTKVLMHKLGQKEFAEWVRRELEGYPRDAKLPDYRMLHAGLYGNFSNIAYQYTKQTLPTGHLSEKERKLFTELDMRESIAALTQLAGAESGLLRREFPPESFHLLEKALQPGTHISSVWGQVGTGAVINILTQVRSRLLDFVLDLREKVGDNPSDAAVREVGEMPETTKAFSQAIYGNNNVSTIVVGNENRVKVEVKAGDFSALEALLRKHGIEEADTNALHAAIDEDAKAGRDGEGFGPRVKTWIREMMGKVVEGSWAIELGIAGNLLTDALKAYYG